MLAKDLSGIVVCEAWRLIEVTDAVGQRKAEYLDVMKTKEDGSRNSRGKTVEKCTGLDC